MTWELGRGGWAVGIGLVALVVVGAFWLSHSPAPPEWAGDRFLLQCYMAGVRIATLLTLSVPFLTGFTVSQNDVMRWVIELAYTNHIPADDAWVGVTHTEFDGVPVKIFHPRAVKSDSPGIVYIHGGGWSILSADSYSATTYYMAWKLNVVVVSIDYRLAPEHPYPEPFDDCVKATIHFMRDAGKHGVNPNRIAIAGDSAGGNLAAAVALKLADEQDKNSNGVFRGLPKLKLQVLIYPAVQLLNLNTWSYNTFADTGVLTKETMLTMWLNYLGFPELHDQVKVFSANNHTTKKFKKSTLGSYVAHEKLPENFRVKDFQTVGSDAGFENDTLSAMVESRLSDPYLCPLMSRDLSKVPPAYLILAQNDPLRDEGLLYAQRLRAAGVETELDFHETMGHGFCNLSPVSWLSFDGGKKAFDTLANYVDKYL